jgi:hypothetical protein
MSPRNHPSTRSAAARCVLVADRTHVIRAITSALARAGKA